MFTQMYNFLLNIPEPYNFYTKTKKGAMSSLTIYYNFSYKKIILLLASSWTKFA